MAEAALTLGQRLEMGFEEPEKARLMRVSE